MISRKLGINFSGKSLPRRVLPPKSKTLQDLPRWLEGYVLDMREGQRALHAGLCRRQVDKNIYLDFPLTVRYIGDPETVK